MRKEAIYARQSINKKDSVSIETQQAECSKIISDSYEEYSDRGYSGKNTSRPALQRLIADISADRISRVVVYRLDRISRSIVDFYDLFELMESHNCRFTSVSEAFDTEGITGRAMMGILAVFAQMERETIQQRVKDNYYYRITDGRWAGGPAPIGFDNAKTPWGSPTLTQNDDMDAVKLAFELYAGEPDISLGKVSSLLTEKGYEINGKPYWTATVSRLLRNPVYAQADEILYIYYLGKRVNFLNARESWSGKTSAAIVGKRQNRKTVPEKEWSIYLTNFEGIVDSRTFILIQNKLDKNESLGKANKSDALMGELSGLIKCAKCGYAVKMRPNAPTLSCDGRSRLHICSASFRGVRIEGIRQQVDSYCQQFIDDIIKQQEIENLKKKELEDRAKELNDEISHLLDMAALNELFSEAAIGAIEKREKELNEIELELSFSKTNVQDGLKRILKVDAAFPEKIDYRTLPVEIKKNVCKALISKILLHEDGSVTIVPNLTYATDV